MSDAAKAFFDTHGYYERQNYNPESRSTYLAWSREMDSSPRHCWPDKDGNLTLASGTHKTCVGGHDVKLIGAPEWMRFIREFGSLAPEGQKYFTDDSIIFIDPVGQLTADGVRCYAEVYLSKQKHDPAFRVFLHRSGIATIECYFPELYDLCQKAWMEVQTTWELMRTRYQSVA